MSPCHAEKRKMLFTDTLHAATKENPSAEPEFDLSFMATEHLLNV